MKKRLFVFLYSVFFITSPMFCVPEVFNRVYTEYNNYCEELTTPFLYYFLLGDVKKRCKRHCAQDAAIVKRLFDILDKKGISHTTILDQWRLGETSPSSLFNADEILQIAGTTMTRDQTTLKDIQQVLNGDDRQAYMKLLENRRKNREIIMDAEKTVATTVDEFLVLVTAIKLDNEKKKS